MSKPDKKGERIARSPFLSFQFHVRAFATERPSNLFHTLHSPHFAAFFGACAVRSDDYSNPGSRFSSAFCSFVPHDPLFSICWTQREHALTALIRVDDETLRVMGTGLEEMGSLHQTDLKLGNRFRNGWKTQAHQLEYKRHLDSSSGEVAS